MATFARRFTAEVVKIRNNKGGKPLTLDNQDLVSKVMSCFSMPLKEAVRGHLSILSMYKEGKISIVRGGYQTVEEQYTWEEVLVVAQNKTRANCESSGVAASHSTLLRPSGATTTSKTSSADTRQHIAVPRAAAPLPHRAQVQ